MIDDKEVAFLNVGFALDDWWRACGIKKHFGAVVVGIGPDGVDIQWFGDRRLDEERIKEIVVHAIDMWNSGEYSIDHNAAVDFDR